MATGYSRDRRSVRRWAALYAWVRPGWSAVGDQLGSATHLDVAMSRANPPYLADVVDVAVLAFLLLLSSSLTPLFVVSWFGGTFA